MSSAGARGAGVHVRGEMGVGGRRAAPHVPDELLTKRRTDRSSGAGGTADEGPYAPLVK
ncbi:hypothetical protein [Streptomyces sp. 840.1]|uniref:hypothetical protein n=1 Tax=Streptomyces sp. 840.1 TaxID=2485152 RepID=UPI00160E1588|nr:hypothetical protein [Streptomyces sp. 840.1]